MSATATIPTARPTLHNGLRFSFFMTTSSSHNGFMGRVGLLGNVGDRRNALLHSRQRDDVSCGGERDRFDAARRPHAARIRHWPGRRRARASSGTTARRTSARRPRRCSPRPSGSASAGVATTGRATAARPRIPGRDVASAAADVAAVADALGHRPVRGAWATPAAARTRWPAARCCPSACSRWSAGPGWRRSTPTGSTGSPGWPPPGVAIAARRAGGRAAKERYEASGIEPEMIHAGRPRGVRRRLVLVRRGRRAGPGGRSRRR